MNLSVAIVLGWLGATAAQTAPPVPPPTPPAASAPAPAAPAAPAATEEAKPPVFEFKPGGGQKCIQPCIKGDAKVEAGAIETTPEDNKLKIVMTGGAGANLWLGCDSSAMQTFRLVQQFEVTCSDSSVREVVLTLESALVGFVRSQLKASACVQVADVTVTPLNGGPPLSLAHSPLCSVGTNGQMSKDPLPAVHSPALPLGSYQIQANFALLATAGGYLNAHSTAIFAPKPEVLDPWEREHDQFKGEEKEGYGFNVTITATPVGAPLPVACDFKPKKKKDRTVR